MLNISKVTDNRGRVLIQDPPIARLLFQSTLASWFSRGIRWDPDPFKGCMLAGDPGGPERCAIQRHRASAATDGHDGNIHGDLIEVLAVWPPVRNPPADGGEHRLAWLGFRHGLSKPVRHLRQHKDRGARLCAAP